MIDDPKTQCRENNEKLVLKYFYFVLIATEIEAQLIA